MAEPSGESVQEVSPVPVILASIPAAYIPISPDPEAGAALAKLVEAFVDYLNVVARTGSASQ